MERLVALMCWLFNSEQHLDRNICKLEEDKHEVMGGRCDLKRRREGSEV